MMSTPSATIARATPSGSCKSEFSMGGRVACGDPRARVGRVLVGEGDGERALREASSSSTSAFPRRRAGGIGRASGRGRGGAAVGGERGEAHREGGAAAGLGLQVDRAAVLDDDLLREGEAEAGAALLGG